MKKLIILLLLAGGSCFAQFDASTLQGKQPCTATRTTNCIATDATVSGGGAGLPSGCTSPGSGQITCDSTISAASFVGTGPFSAGGACQADASVATPAAGSITLYCASDHSNLPYYKTSAGTAVPFVYAGGALGTPSSGTGTNITGIPLPPRAIGCGVGDPAGSALATGVLCYIVAPSACTITSWDILVDSGTATAGIWKIATGTAIPTVSNSIVASAAPAISTGTAVHSTTMTGWTTSVSAFDVFGFNLTTTSGPKYIYVGVNCAGVN